MKFRFTILTLILTLLRFGGFDSLNAQTNELSDLQSARISDNTQSGDGAIDDFVSIYQKFISGNRGSKCGMYPSCSAFGSKTFGEKNFAYAMVLTSDRLLRCGHEHAYYDLTYRNGDYKLLDYPLYTANPDSLVYKSPKQLFAYSDVENYNDSSMLFIRHLMNNKYYSEALLEINRLQFFDKKANNELLLNKLICLRALDKGENAIFEYETRFAPEARSNPSISLQTALIYYDLKNFEATNRLLDNMDVTLAKTNVQANSNRLRGLSEAQLGNWAKARQAFEMANKLDPNADLLKRNNDLIESIQTFKPKSRTKASVLAIVPGLGYLYTGHKQTALASFAINGLLAYATYTSIKKENYGVAALTGIFSASFYIGNIIGSGQSAKRYNEHKARSIINTLEYNNIFNY